MRWPCWLMPVRSEPKVNHMHHAEKPIAEPVGDPYAALTVDGEAAAIVADLEVLDLAGIGIFWGSG